jgi:hypothetical protein
VTTGTSETCWSQREAATFILPALANAMPGRSRAAGRRSSTEFLRPLPASSQYTVAARPLHEHNDTSVTVAHICNNAGGKQAVTAESRWQLPRLNGPRPETDLRLAARTRLGTPVACRTFRVLRRRRAGPFARNGCAGTHQSEWPFASILGNWRACPCSSTPRPP